MNICANKLYHVLETKKVVDLKEISQSQVQNGLSMRQRQRQRERERGRGRESRKGKRWRKDCP